MIVDTEWLAGSLVWSCVGGGASAALIYLTGFCHGYWVRHHKPRRANDQRA